MVRLPATKHGNRGKKLFFFSPSRLTAVFYFFYNPCCFCCQGRKKPIIRAFPRQQARQQPGTKPATEADSERKILLVGQFDKAFNRILRRNFLVVVGLCFRQDENFLAGCSRRIARHCLLRGRFVDDLSGIILLEYGSFLM